MLHSLYKGLRTSLVVAITACLGLLAIVAISKVSWWNTMPPATAAPPPTDKVDPGSVRVTADQMHQLELVKVGLCSFRQQKTAIGQIAFNENASTNVFTPFSGRVTRLMAQVGDEVKRGDPLFEIDSPEVVQVQTDLIAALHGRDKANAHLDVVKRQADRQKRLFQDKATSQREMEQAQNDLAAAESDFKTAEGALTAARHRLRVIIGRDKDEVERLERERIINPLLTVNAPIGGNVVARRIGPGQFVKTDAAEAHFSISDLSTMWLKAFVAEADIPHVRVGQEIDVRILALPDRRVQARIDAIGASSDPATRRVMVRSEIPNPDGLLRAEMFATFRITVGSVEATTAVPTAAVIRKGEETRLWVEKEPQVFQSRAVKIGAEQNGCIQIRDGIGPGETVISRGAIFVDNEARQ
jgi:cobalt-zinc-cadmium efflux system membrane fusion protein